MDQLSHELVKINGESFIASEGAWESRVSYWNRRSPRSWQIRKSQRGPDVPIPADIIDLPYWRDWDIDIGLLARWKKSQLSQYNMTYAPSVVGLVSSHTFAQTSTRGVSYWKAQEGQDWGISSNGSESGASHAPSVFSGASKSTGCSSQLVAEPTYTHNAANSNTGATSWLSEDSKSWEDIVPPQLPNLDHFDGRRDDCDGFLTIQHPAKTPEIYEADFDYNANMISHQPASGIGISYTSLENVGPLPLAVPSVQTNQRISYIPTDHEGAKSHVADQSQNGELYDTVALPSVVSSVRLGTLRLPPRETIQHTMDLYGEPAPWEDFADVGQGHGGEVYGRLRMEAMDLS